MTDKTEKDTKPIDEEKTEEKVATEILFYCKICKELVKNPKKIGNKYVYKCPHCGKDKVAFGSKESIESYFNL